jgi:hypothetical protein
MAEAIRFMRQNPQRSLELALRKFVFYWGMDITHPKARNPLYWGSWAVVFPLFLIGLLESRHQWQRYTLFHLYFALETTTAMVFFVLARYRVFVEPFVLLFAAEGGGCIINRYWRRG